MSFPHIPALIHASIERWPDRPALTVTRDGVTTTRTYAEFGALAHRAAEAFVDLGVQPGDRVAIFAGNSPEWSIADLAIMEAGAAPMTVYATVTAEQLLPLLLDSGACGILVGDVPQLEKFAAIAERAPHVRFAVLLDSAPHEVTIPGVEVLDAQTLMTADASAGAAAEVDRRVAALDRDDLATLIYTSGTTGEPKGVAVSHGNFLSAVQAIHELFDLRPTYRSMCFLPLSHAFERGWTLVVFNHGMENVYVVNPKNVAAEMVAIRPDVFCSVPRLFEKVYAVASERAGSGAKRRLFDWAISVGKRYEDLRRAGRSVSPQLRAAHAVADRIVLHHIRDAVGGRKVLMASGGAPLRQEVVDFFHAGGLPVYQGYGLTETAPMISCNSPGHVRDGSVGRPIPRCEVRIGDEGEILARGGNVFRGYWGRPEFSDEAFVDGWYRTGDIGHLDEDGYLFITDRLKDLIITAQGKNVAPAPLEAALAGDPLVEAAVVLGDNHKYLVALLQPDFPALEAEAATRGWPTDRAALLTHPDVLAYFEGVVERSGAGRASFERVQKFRFLPEPLTMEDGMLTPTLKVRRRKVEERYHELVADMYGTENPDPARTHDG